jgi:hypothetical protein
MQVDAPSDETGRLMKPMTRDEALRRLGSVPLGRIVFTRHAMPVIRPANHLIDEGQVIIGSHESPAIAIAAGQGPGTVVVYEADDLDPATRTGWSVMVTGLARLVTDPGQAARYRQALRPWLAGPISQVISIDPQIVSGFELIAETGLLVPGHPRCNFHAYDLMAGQPKRRVLRSAARWQMIGLCLAEPALSWVP